MTSTAPKLVSDGLWHCLCPSFNSTSLRSSRNVIVRRRRPALQCAAAAATASCATRRNSSAPTQGDVDGGARHAHDLGLPRAQLRSKLPIMDAWAPLGSERQEKQYPGAIRSTMRNKPVVRRGNLSDLSVPDVYELAHTAAGKGNNREARRLVEHLVQERREQINLRMYSILILANVHPTEGSARRVARLLQEMEGEGLQMDAQICHDVLRVLSVHLDYLLRTDILHYMRNRWIQLSSDGYHWVGAALFREAQLELGLEHLDAMRKDAVSVQPWLFDIAMYSMLEMSEFDEALTLVKDRVAANDWSISKDLWSHMLDRASAAFHHQATVYCWNSHVIPGYLNPSSGVCLNVLTTAARNGDAALATSVFHVLGKRSTVFKQIHYDQLLSTYMSTSPPDLRAAFSVLAIMASVKIEPNAASTRSILTYLRKHPADCERVFDILVSLHESGREIPVAALNVLIEAYVECRRLEQALVVYKHMHLFERAPVDRHGRPARRRPFSNLETFSVMLRGASMTLSHDGYDTAMFLVSEMLALGIKPDYLVYDRLVFISIHADNKLDNAYRYFDEMEELGFLPRQSTVELLAIALAKASDARCWDVLQRMHDRDNLGPKTKGEVELVFARANKEGLTADTNDALAAQQM